MDLLAHLLQLDNSACQVTKFCPAQGEGCGCPDNCWHMFQSAAKAGGKGKAKAGDDPGILDWHLQSRLFAQDQAESTWRSIQDEEVRELRVRP